jgi:N-acetylglucosaminyldiphosphoundecaprenol N-acetyl-beta-D-mannosaminyltransferase
MLDRRVTGNVLGVEIDSMSWLATLSRLHDWAKRRESRYVCICNVHSVVTASQDESFSLIVNAADMATPDGEPVAWMLRRLGNLGQQRINGPDLMWKYCQLASARDESIYFYGSTPDTLSRLAVKFGELLPTLRIAGMYSPPFRALTALEDDVIINRINAADAGIVFVSLGCPKQEIWMAEHRGRIDAVMIGVGAAFDYHAGTIRRAPVWMQERGLEWFYRLATEPRRLWRRYFFTNGRFILQAIKLLYMKPGQSLRDIELR